MISNQNTDFNYKHDQNSVMSETLKISQRTKFTDCKARYLLSFDLCDLFTLSNSAICFLGNLVSYSDVICLTLKDKSR